jgi:RNA polymerase sigma-70 factor (ECF subfamily)
LKDVVQGDERSLAHDELLLIQVAQRNQAAFAELFDRLAPAVLGVLTRLTGRQDLAEQVLEETFLQCWIHAGTYRPEQGSPRAWLLGIATTRGAACLRRARSLNAGGWKGPERRSKPRTSGPYPRAQPAGSTP